MNGPNKAEVVPVGNSMTVEKNGNQVDVNLFAVTSTYFLLTQFLPYRHDSKVSVET